jgi:hypothetical protein
MYWSKTKQQYNKKTRGEKLWEYLQQTGTYTKHTSTKLQKTPKINNLKQPEDITDKKRSQPTKH